jgi:DNA-binding response OmpR family regulator
VPDGAVALAVIAAVRADLVILDVDLPGLDGFELYDRLRAKPDTAGIQVLFTSAAHHERELARRGLRTFLRKPFDLDDLLAHVAALLEQADARHEPPSTGTVASP